MTDLSIIFSASRQLPWDSIFLGGLMTTTSLQTVLSWRISKQIKEMASDSTEGRSSALDESVVIVDDEGGTLQLASGYTWQINGASRIGQVRTENQDAFVYIQDKLSTAFLAVFDGAGGLDGGKEAAQSAAKVCQKVMEETRDSDLSPEERLSKAIDEAREFFRDQKIPGITTAILAYVKDYKLTYATLGDGALAAIWPDGMISQILVPHHVMGQPENVIAGYIGKDCDVPPRIGSVNLEPGTTLMLMSDGASDLFPYVDYASRRDQFSDYLRQNNDSDSDNSLASHFLTQIEEARDPDSGAYLHSDNMTLVLAHLTETEHA